MMGKRVMLAAYVAMAAANAVAAQSAHHQRVIDPHAPDDYRQGRVKSKPRHSKLAQLKRQKVRLK